MKVCLLFVRPLMKLVFLPYFYWLVYFFNEFTHHNFTHFPFGWLYFLTGISYRTSSYTCDINPLLNIHVVNIFPWSVYPFCYGFPYHKAVFNFYASDLCRTLIRWDLFCILFHHLHVLVFVFTSPAVYFCIDKNMTFFVFQMKRQLLHICWI